MKIQKIFKKKQTTIYILLKNMEESWLSLLGFYTCIAIPIAIILITWILIGNKKKKEFNAANKEFNKWNYLQALKLYNKVTKKIPKHKAAYWYKAIIFEKLNDDNKAITEYDNVLNIDNKYIQAYRNKWLIFIKTKQYKKAIKQFSKIIEIDKTHEEAYIQRWITLEFLNKYDEAINCYNNAIKLNKKNKLAQYLIQLILKEKPSLTINTEKKKDIDYASAYYNKWLLLEWLNQYNKAIKCHNKTIEIKPNATLAYIQKSSILLIQGKYLEEIECLKKILDMPTPRKDTIYYALATANAMIKNKKESIKNLKKAIELDSTKVYLAKSDPAFNNICKLKEFKKIISK